MVSSWLEDGEWFGGRQEVNFQGPGLCQWGKCIIQGERCEPWGFCPLHCKEFHKTHPKVGELQLENATLIVEEKL